MNLLFSIVNVALLVVCMAVVAYLQKKKKSFTTRVLTSLGLGVLIGVAIKLLFGANKEIMAGTLPWFRLVGDGYVGLLRMIIMPLVMVSIVSAILKLKDAKNLGKMSTSVILVLVLTAGISAGVGELSALA